MELNCPCGYKNSGLYSTCYKCENYLAKPGDWRCDKCGDLNFAKRIECRICYNPKRKEKNIINKKLKSSCIYCNNTCIICMENIAKMAFIKCGHMITCEKCCYNLNECPFCRVPLQQNDIIRIYHT